MVSSFTAEVWRIPCAPQAGTGIVFWDNSSVAFHCSDVSRPIEGLQPDCFSIPNSWAHTANCGQGGYKEPLDSETCVG